MHSFLHPRRLLVHPHTMSPPLFLPPLPLPLHPNSNPSVTSDHSICPQTVTRTPSATLSLPYHPGPRSFHSDETKRKIGLAVRLRAEARRKHLSSFILSIQSDGRSSTDSKTESDCEDVSDSTPPSTSTRKYRKSASLNSKQNTSTPRKPRRKLSPESRAKISAALKGKAKSAEHRESLRKRFEGDGNPMYGRKLSAESRAKISAAMADRAKQRRLEEEKKLGKGGGRLEEREVMEDLREKAKESRLLTEGRKKSDEQNLQDQAEEKHVEEILRGVRRGERPPDRVSKAVERSSKSREDESGKKKGKVREKREGLCGRCEGSGFVGCPQCVGCFGVVSAKCECCFGAGATFCSECEGVGQAGI